MERLQAPSKAETGMMEGMMTVSDFTFLFSFLMPNVLQGQGPSGEAHLNNVPTAALLIVHVL